MICITHTYILGGACGFGEYGRTVNDGSVAGVSKLWKNGSGCGACYQVEKQIFIYTTKTIHIH